MTLLFLVGITVLPVIFLLRALCFGIFNWEKPGGKAVTIVAGSLLLLAAITMAGYFLLLQTRDASMRVQPILQQH